MAWPPRASSWLTSPLGPSLRNTLPITCSGMSGDQIGRIMRAVIIMSRPKKVAAVERGTLDPDGLDTVSRVQLEAGNEAAAELVQVLGVEQLEVAPLLIRRKPRHVGHQERLLR